MKMFLGLIVSFGLVSSAFAGTECLADLDFFQFETPRSTLRPMVQSDFEGIMAIVSNPNNIEMSGDHFNSLDFYSSLYANSIFSPHSWTQVTLAVELKGRSGVFGIFNLSRNGELNHLVEEEARAEGLFGISSANSVMIGGSLLQEVWGNGLMVEITGGFVEHSQRLGIANIFACIIETNERSRRGLARLGFTPLLQPIEFRSNNSYNCFILNNLG